MNNLIDFLGDAIANDSAYRFKYPPPGFAVSSAVHPEDLPPINWITEVARRAAHNGEAQIAPGLFETFFRNDTSAPADRPIDDDDFAALRVAGFNPLVLKRMTLNDESYLVERFPGCLSYVFNDHDNFPAALADNRIFAVDFSALSSITESSLRIADDKRLKKWLYFPIGLFRIPLGDNQPLQVVAIKVGQHSTDPVYRPGDNQWRQAKLAFNCADGNYHELISHLGRTHLLIEPFVVSTPRVFLEDHWVRRLLSPHFCGTATINALAFKALINTGGTLEDLLCGGLDSELQISFDSIQNPGFRDLMLPAYLEARGLLDERLLYPYRDDAFDLWNAIHSWVNDFASIHCPTDEHLRNDPYIHNWVADASVGGKVAGLGDVTSLADLVNVLTMIIFTASAQHAAVNFAQADKMDDGKAVPLALYGDVTTAPVQDIIPPRSMLTLQMNIANLLGGVYFTQLGDYVEYGIHAHAALEPVVVPRQFPNNYIVFTNEQELAALHRFRSNLDQVGIRITERNNSCAFRKRFPYWYLYPENIPQSINI